MRKRMCSVGDGGGGAWLTWLLMIFIMMTTTALAALAAVFAWLTDPAQWDHNTKIYSGKKWFAARFRRIEVLLIWNWRDISFSKLVCSRQNRDSFPSPPCSRAAWETHGSYQFTVLCSVQFCVYTTILRHFPPYINRATGGVKTKFISLAAAAGAAMLKTKCCFEGSLTDKEQRALLFPPFPFVLTPTASRIGAAIFFAGSLRIWILRSDFYFGSASVTFVQPPVKMFVRVIHFACAAVNPLKSVLGGCFLRMSFVFACRSSAAVAQNVTHICCYLFQPLQSWEREAKNASGSLLNSCSYLRSASLIFLTALLEPFCLR